MTAMTMITKICDLQRFQTLLIWCSTIVQNFNIATEMSVLMSLVYLYTASSVKLPPPPCLVR